MGNSTSSSRNGESKVDEGFLTPHGIYTGPHDWNSQNVGHFIVERRLAPFYRPLEEYDESWDDETILAARRGPEPEHDAEQNGSQSKHTKAHSKSNKESQKHSESAIYKGAIECPICFMFYPPNINRTRCCFQAICTECFVQIKRNEPTPTHLVSEPACCPYCQQENFGITYTPPPWRTGLTPDPSNLPRPDLNKTPSDSSRRKSLSHNSPEVVTTDQIRPDWEERLAAIKAAVARRANRRIIMRQVGDRLIPVGVTSSRTVLPEGITTVEDIEELMLMEAMRLSLLDQDRANPASGSESNRAPVNNHQASNVASNGLPSASSETIAVDDSRRRGPSIVSALTAPLTNASNLIAVTTALPSSGSPPALREANSSTPPASDAPSIINTLRERLSSSSSHRRADSSPPPATTLSAALSANLTANAFLRPSGESTSNSVRASVDTGSTHNSQGGSTENRHDQEGGAAVSVGSQILMEDSAISSTPLKGASTVVDAMQDEINAPTTTTTTSTTTGSEH